MRFHQHHQVNKIPAYVLTHNERLDTNFVVVACEKKKYSDISSVAYFCTLRADIQKKKKPFFIVVRRGLPTKHYKYIDTAKCMYKCKCNQKIREVEFSVHTVSSLAEEVTQESYYNRDFYKAV